MERIGNDIVTMPNIMKPAAKIIPAMVQGYTSPYPTVDKVWTAQYMHCGIVENSPSAWSSRKWRGFIKKIGTKNYLMKKNLRRKLIKQCLSKLFNVLNT